MIKRSPYPLLVPLALALLLFSCGGPGAVSNEEREAQRQQWLDQMNETFSAYTQDTVELHQRLEFYREEDNKLGQVATYRILGVQARYASQFQKAIELHATGLELARRIADTVNITILLNDLATDYRRIGAYNDAAPYSYEALQIGEQYRGSDSLSIQRNMASAYNGIGNIYLPMEQYDEAMKAFEKALELDTRQNNHWGIAVNLSNIGSIHFSRKEYEKAEEYYRHSMVHNEQANQLVGTALGHINLGELFQAQERFDEALAEYRLAYDALNGSTDELHWMDAAFHIAYIHIREGRPAQSVPYIEEGLRKARQIHSLRHLSRGYQLYSTYNYDRGDYRRAVDDLRRVQAYNDTIRQNQESERLLESRIAHENELHTREIEERDRNAREHELRSRNRSLQFLALLAALLAVMVVLIHKRRMAHRQSAEVQKLERMRSNLFTRMTHEFRTPLTTIIGNSDLLLKKYNGRESADPADVDKYGTIIRNGNTLLKLVDGLLEFSRSESGNNKLMWRHGDLAAFVRAVAEPYEKSAQDKNINLSVVSDTNKLEMNYAPEGIVSVFRNLLSNAIRHTPSGGRIEVLLRHDRRSKRCVITIRDNGEGISPENLPNIFELYYTSDIDGMGIGLAHTKQLVEEMSGTIGVISTHGRGTEFTVSLPIALMEIPEDRRATPSDNFTHHVPDNETDEIKRYGNPDPEEIENDNRSVILVVEDNRDVANYIRNVLGDGYIILHALNGVEGFDMAEKYVPDLIITDLMMPQKDGYALTADIRASVVASHIPIIMLTAKATGDDRKEGFKAGADAYLFKPFDEEELLVRVKQMLDSRARLRDIYSGAVLTGGFDSTASDKIADNDKDFIAHLSMVIGSHIDDEDYFPGKLSQEMCLSVSQLNRKLKTMTGNTLSSFVMDARLRRAKLLLSKGGQSIKEVAFACGFSDLGYFSRSFKNAFGCAPSQFSKTAIK